MLSTHRIHAGPSSFDAYVEDHGGWKDGLGRCEMCGTGTERLLDGYCENCARWMHGYDDGEVTATKALRRLITT